MEDNKVVGDSFEDMSISDMVQVQGSGDVNVETTPSPSVVITVSDALMSAGASGALSYGVTRTAKGKCT